MPHRVYRLGLTVPETKIVPNPPYRGRGWHIDLHSSRYVGKDLEAFGDAYRAEYGHQPQFRDFTSLLDGSVEVTTKPVFLIRAANRGKAQEAANYFRYAFVVANGYDHFGDGHPLFASPPLALPADEGDLEGLPEEEYRRAKRSVSTTEGFPISAALAARCSNRIKWKRALVSLWTSYRLCGVPWFDHHPEDGRWFGVETEYESHAIFGLSIIAAYSAIEELGLQVRASNERPSIKDGKWNPPVLADLKHRLQAAQINLNKDVPWIVRNPPTRLERQRPIPSEKRGTWSRRSVRDRMVKVVDAINYASWLRGRASAHGGLRLSGSLTAHAVYNVQHLGRRLLMETTGFWRT